MSGIASWLLVALAIGVVIVRRRSIAVALVTAQALMLALVAAFDRARGEEAVAAGALGLRAVALAAFFWLLVSRTREERPVRAGAAPLARAGAAIVLALCLVWLVPSFGLEQANAERASLSIVAVGLVIVAMRNATLFQVLGIVVVENALALAALSLPGESSLVIEIGVTLDLLLVALVAGVFHDRIFAEFGTGDAARLRTLRD
jgi:hydrogenase-4 membrane subunit HyfE